METITNFGRGKSHSEYLGQSTNVFCPYITMPNTISLKLEKIQRKILQGGEKTYYNFNQIGVLFAQKRETLDSELGIYQYSIGHCLGKWS